MSAASDENGGGPNVWVRGRGGWGGNLDEKFTALGCGDLVERLAEVIPDEFTPQLHQKAEC